MKQPNSRRTRKNAKSQSLPAKRKEQAVIDTEHLLEEVAEDNKDVHDPAERERVVPSRPC